ncbi:MAG: PAS domain S-box protein [Alphaproteobacteria bacterium]
MDLEEDGDVIAFLDEPEEVQPGYAMSDEAASSPFRRMLDFSLDAAYVHVDDIIVYANDATVRMAGARRVEDIVGRRASAFLTPEARGRLVEARRQIRADGRTASLFQFRLQRLDGGETDVESTGVEIEWEGYRAVLVFVRDVSERMRAENRLRESEANLRGLLEGFPDAFYVHANDRLLFANPAMAQMFGFDRPQDMIGHSVLALYHPSTRATILEARKSMPTRTDTGKFTSRIEALCLHRDGTMFTAQAAARNVRWEGREAIVVNLRDISERIEHERQLRRARHGCAM